MGATGFGLALGGISALSGLAGAEKQRSQQNQQAAMMEAQAANLRQNAALEKQRGEIEARAIDRQKSAIHARFNEQTGRNRSLLAAGNVDMSTGSAADVQQGSINALADDMSENAYSRLLRLYQADQQAKSLNWQADAQDAQASWLKKTSGNLATSLLTAGLAGAGGFASGYSMAGGKLSSLFGSTTQKATGGISAISGGKLSLKPGPGASGLAKTLLGY